MYLSVTQDGIVWMDGWSGVGTGTDPVLVGRRTGSRRSRCLITIRSVCKSLESFDLQLERHE